MTTHGVRLLCLTIALLALVALPATAAAGPDVRIVRLSLAQGDVQVDRNIAGNQGQGWEQAINNMPLTEGARLYAAENSKAELEFEDGSSVRLAGPAQIALNQLSLAPDGSPLNQIEVDSGLVYVNARLNDHASFRIQDPNGESFAITQPTHLRFNVEEQVALLSVIDGEVEALDDSGSAKIHGGESYNYILGQPQSAARVDKVPPENEDAWDRQRDQYDDQYAAAGAQYSDSENPDAYGQADLGYYGSYQDIPGYGESWQPNGVGPDWNPYDNGAWSYYPDWGWTFVSAYPWGWCPFYFGDWSYVNGRGWWWHPGPGHRHGEPHGLGHSGGFHAQPMLTSTPHGFSAPHPPAGSSHRTVALAGSNLRVGPIGLTHASIARDTITRDTMPREALSNQASRAAMTRSGGAPVGANATRSAGFSGASSNFVHGSRASIRAGSLIGGQRGAYYVTHPTSGRAGYDVNRSPEGSGGASRTAPRATAYSGETPRAYSYSGGAAPRAYAPRTYGGSAPSYTPRAYSAPTAPPVTSAPHIGGGGGFSGGGFHGGGGGFSGGGGFHGGGGGRR
jgi:hypothetical protein